ncbi:MAG TPA: hypothetical protein VHB97_05560 [Polyangia bacterium]|jgi:hypothetical protein|nr:hypothetical protein [Polyangia bacterium]
MENTDPIRLKTRPDRIFVSVDQSTGRSTISFAPSEAGKPILHEDDRTGALAMRDAKAICDSYPGASIHGPHFHAARPPGRKRMTRKAVTNE